MGKVSGIHGDVDINVFNGYKNQYEDFLRKHCIKEKYCCSLTFETQQRMLLKGQEK